MNEADRELRAIQLLKQMLSAHDSEQEDCGCGMCGDKMDCLAELVLAGGKPVGALEAIQQHIECCASCRAEYEALLGILRAEHQDD